MGGGGEEIRGGGGARMELGASGMKMCSTAAAPHAVMTEMAVAVAAAGPVDLRNSLAAGPVQGSIYGTSFTQKAGNRRRGKVENCPGSTTIVAPKSVGSRATNRQMKAIS